MNKDNLLRTITQITAFLAIILPAAIELILIRKHAQSLLLSIQLPVWCCIVPSVAMTLTAIPHGLSVTATEKARLPVLALFFAASVAGLVWPVLLFHNQAFGLAGLWLMVAAGVTLSIAGVSRGQIVRMLMLSNAALHVLLAAAVFALAAHAA